MYQLTLGNTCFLLYCRLNYGMWGTLIQSTTLLTSLTQSDNKSGSCNTKATVRRINGFPPPFFPFWRFNPIRERKMRLGSNLWCSWLRCFLSHLAVIELLKKFVVILDTGGRRAKKLWLDAVRSLFSTVQFNVFKFVWSFHVHFDLSNDVFTK
jgi:hypothetical protein